MPSVRAVSAATRRCRRDELRGRSATTRARRLPPTAARAVELRGIIDIELRPNAKGQRGQPDPGESSQLHFRPQTQADMRDAPGGEVDKLSGSGRVRSLADIQSQFALDEHEGVRRKGPSENREVDRPF